MSVELRHAVKDLQQFIYDYNFLREADIVRLIFAKYVNEGYGVQKIANYLNANGYQNPTGNPWSHNTIRNILQNETYVGILKSGETRSPHARRRRLRRRKDR